MSIFKIGNQSDSPILIQPAGEQIATIKPQVDGVFRITVDKKKAKIEFENESEDSVDVIIRPRP